MKRLLVLFTLSMSLILTGCGQAASSEPVDYYVPVEHKDTPIKLLDDIYVSYDILYSTIDYAPQYAYLLGDSTGTYKVFNKKPVDCDDVNNYTLSGKYMELSDESAISLNYLSKEVGDYKLSGKFYCNLLYNSAGEITGVTIEMKGDDA